MKTLSAALVSFGIGLAAGILGWSEPATSERAPPSEAPGGAHSEQSRATKPPPDPRRGLDTPGFALLSIGADRLLEGFWDGKGRFVATRSRTLAEIGSGSYPVLKPEDIRAFSWHNDVNLLTRDSSRREIELMLAELKQGGGD